MVSATAILNDTYCCSQSQEPLFIITSSSQGDGVLRISSDGDDGRIFWGLKFSISGFFRVGNFVEASVAKR